MPYSITLQGNCAHLTFSGRLTVAEVTEATRSLEANVTENGTTPHRLVDITAVENLEVSFSEMHAFTQSRRGALLRNKVQTAIVAGSSVQFGIARMFELMNTQPQTEVRVFRDPAAAANWIEGKPVEEAGRVI
jgi:hypothetical protein